MNEQRKVNQIKQSRHYGRTRSCYLTSVYMMGRNIFSSHKVAMHSGRARGESPLALRLLPPEEREGAIPITENVSRLLIIQAHGRMRLVILKAAQSLYYRLP